MHVIGEVGILTGLGVHVIGILTELNMHVIGKGWHSYRAQYMYACDR